MACKAITCLAPGNVTGSNLSSNAVYPFNTKAVFSCPSGHRLVTLSGAGGVVEAAEFETFCTEPKGDDPSDKGQWRPSPINGYICLGM